MSRVGKINRNWQRCLITFNRLLHLAPGLVVLVSLLLVFMPAAAAFAKGGDPVSPFPAVDARAGLQYAKAMAVDAAGNIIVVGYTDSGSGDDYQVAKFKADGSGLAWPPVSYAHAGAGDDIATAVAIDSSGNIIVTGSVWNAANKEDIHTIKYNGSSGAVIWQHTYVSGGKDTATAIAVDGSGDIYVAGYSFNGTRRDDFLIIKYPSGGATPAWVELYDDTAYPDNDNRILAIAAGSDGIAVTGYSSKGGADFDILTRKYGFDGTLAKEWRYSSAGSRDDRGIAVKMDSSGKVIVTGFVSNAANNTDIYTVKYDPGSSTPLWEKTYDGNANDEPKGLWVDGSGDVYVTGYTTTLAGNQDFFTVRYQGSDGTELWKSVLDAGNGSTDIPAGIVVDSAADGGVFVTGYSTVTGNEDYLTVKYRKDNGTLLWEKKWNGADNKNDRPVGIALEPAGGPTPRNVIVAGWSESSTNGYDFAALKYDYGVLNAPSGLTAAAASNTSLTLTWIDNSSNEDTFIIQRKLGESGTFADITTVPATLPANTFTYTDGGLIANNYYYYRVRAYSAANGDSYYSNEARALTKVVSYDTPVWKFIYNSADNRKDVATGITVGLDDHPVVTGYSDQSEEGVPGQYSNDYVTMKLDRANDQSIKWKAIYDSGDGGTDMAAGLALDNLGNVLVTGTAYLTGGGDKSDDLYTRKVATAGLNDPAAVPALLWDHQYGTLAGIDMATAIEMVEDGSNNSVVIGHGSNASGNDDIFIIKYNNDGTLPWPPIIYNSGRHDIPSAVAFDTAGNIFVTGYSFDTAADPNGSYDWFTAKYNGTDGALIWSETYNVSSVAFGVVSGNDLALSIDVDKAGNAYVSGYATNAAGNTVFYTVKYDGAAVPAGNRRIWEKSFNYSGFDADAAALKIDPFDGAVIVAGSAYINATDSDFHLIRYNPADGTEIWNKNFDRTGYDYLTAMTLDSSGYIYLAGNTRTGPDTNAAFDSSSDILSLIYDYEGTFLGAMTFDGSGRQDEATAITVNYQGEAFIAGFSKNASDNADYVVFKQKNNYILVPAPLGVAAQLDYTKIDITWRENTPGTSFRIERTAGPSSPLSVWELIASPASGTAAYTDTGRAAGTNYCYRIDAGIGSLNSKKIEQCVTTSLQAPTLSSLTIESSTQITLNWSQETDNSGYKIERKVAAGDWTDLVIKAAGENSHVDSGLTPGTSYSYRISTKGVSEYSLASNEQTAVTKPAAPALNAPGTITATQVTISWSNVDGESGYNIERKTGAGGIWGEVGSKGVDDLTLADTVPASNTQYYYRVKASNASGSSDYSNEQGALSLFDSTTLSTVTASSTSQVDLAWTDVAGETGYTIQESSCNYNNNPYDTNYCPVYEWAWSGWYNLADVAADVLTYPRAGLASGYAYRYRIISNTTANSSVPSNVIMTWTQMTAPAVTIVPASETALTPTWAKVNAATNYTVEWKPGSGGTWAELAGAIGLAYNATGYTNEGLGLSTEYCYRVKAYSTLPNNPPSIYSDEKCMTTPLAAPVLNEPSVVSDTQINLSWNNVTGNTGYEIQRCNTNYPNNPEYLGYYGDVPAYAYWFWSCSAPIILPQDTVNYSDTGLAAGYTYRYKIRDTYAGGTSAFSAVKDTITNPSAPTLSAAPASTTQMNLSWNDVYGDTGFKLEWKPREGADCTAGSWNAPILIGENGTSTQHAGLTGGTYYCYRLKAYNAYGESAYSNEISQTTQLDPPVLDIPTGVTSIKTDLSWNNVTGNTGYQIERKTGTDGAWGPVGTALQDIITFTDNSGLNAGTLYYYRVRVQNAGGYSLPSNEQSVITTPVATSILNLSVISSDEIDLSWYVVPGASNYKLERKEGAAGSWDVVANIAADYSQSYCGEPYPTVACAALSDVLVSYPNTGLQENTLYYYRVVSWNSSGEDSEPSVENSGTTSAMPKQNLVATPLDGGFRIRLDWTPIVCAACNAPTGYELQRLVRDGNWVLLKAVDGATLTYTDSTAIDPGKKYRYRVRSISGSDKSPYSETMVFAKPYMEGTNACSE